MKRKTNHFVLVALAILMVLGSSACAPAQPAALTDEQLNAVVDNLLQAISTGDYGQFTRDFSPAMLSAFPEASLNDLHDLLQESSGNYVSLVDYTLINQEGYAVYLFQCEYEKENVIARVVFLIGGDKVDGLFFDSTNLRAASK